MFQEWINEYRRLVPDVGIRYQLSGSDAGIRSVLTGDADFALADVPLNASDKAAGTGGEVAQFPMLGFGVAITYNLPTVEALRLRPTTLADIFEGRITSWDHATVRADNPGITLPKTPITVVHRADRSGTTGVLTRYLQQAAPRNWTKGFARLVPFPEGIAARGSDAVVKAIQSRVGTVGYVASPHLGPADLKAAAIENSSRRFVMPNSETVAAALFPAIGNPRDLTLEVPLTEGPAAYPIAGFSYLMFRPQGESPELTALLHFAEWAIGEGQSTAERLGYAPLPLILRIRTLDGLRNGGVPVLRE